MFELLLVIHIIACISIIFFVLLQSGRGAELGAERALAAVSVSLSGDAGRSVSSRTPERVGAPGNLPAQQDQAGAGIAGGRRAADPELPAGKSSEESGSG